MIFRKEDTLGGPSDNDTGKTLDRIEFFTGGFDSDDDLELPGLDPVAKVLEFAARERPRANAATLILDVNGVRPVQQSPA